MNDERERLEQAVLTVDELSKAQYEELLANPDRARAITGRFACFQMIPVEERIGEWRFAGTAENLADAFERCGSLPLRIWPPEDAAWTAVRVLGECVHLYDLEPKPKAWKELGLPAGSRAVIVAQGGGRWQVFEKS